jgi:hypothetical protein
MDTPFLCTTTILLCCIAWFDYVLYIHSVKTLRNILCFQYIVLSDVSSINTHPPGVDKFDPIEQFKSLLPTETASFASPSPSHPPMPVQKVTKHLTSIQESPQVHNNMTNNKKAVLNNTLHLHALDGFYCNTTDCYFLYNSKKHLLCYMSHKEWLEGSLIH